MPSGVALSSGAQNGLRIACMVCENFKTTPLVVRHSKHLRDSRLHEERCTISLDLRSAKDQYASEEAHAGVHYCAACVM